MALKAKPKGCSHRSHYIPEEVVPQNRQLYKFKTEKTSEKNYSALAKNKGKNVMRTVNKGAPKGNKT